MIAQLERTRSTAKQSKGTAQTQKEHQQTMDKQQQNYSLRTDISHVMLTAAAAELGLLHSLVGTLMFI